MLIGTRHTTHHNSAPNIPWTSPIPNMSLVSGPGRGGGTDSLPQELRLYVDKHVSYIQSLDTVRLLRHASPCTF
jgi:hypothetical protein